MSDIIIRNETDKRKFFKYEWNNFRKPILDKLEQINKDYMFVCPEINIYRRGGEKDETNK